MARTNKNGIARSKKAKAKNASKRVKGLNNQKKWRDIAVKPLQYLKDNWLVKAIVNPKGNLYHWFTRGRKSCWETKLKIDKDLFDKWGNKQSVTNYKLRKIK